MQRNSGIQVGEDGSIWIAAKSGGGLAKDGAGQWYIQNGAITADRLAEGAVTADRLASDVNAKFDGKASKQTSNGGFAGGSNADAGTGGAIGYKASANSGGAIGNGAKATLGFSGGNNAKSEVDAIQLGTGTNNNEKTLQVYDHTLLNADGKIPHERFPAYSKTPVRIGPWINGMSVWRVVIDVKLTEDDIQKGRYKLKSKDDLDDGALTIVNATLRTYRDVGWAVDSCPATLGDDFYVEFDNSQPTYNHLQGVIEYVHT